MAKMFYTLDEVAQKLGKSADDVKEMARRGEIQEFRDRDKLMFKVDQIDMLAGGEEESGEIPLALEDSRLGGSGLDLQDSGLALADSRESSSLGSFDTDHGDAAAKPGRTGDKPAARTQAAPGDDELSLEAVGSGSGLLDLTRESDDTSLGAELLEEVYSSEENVEIPANASGLFEAAGVESPGNALAGGGGIALTPMAMEAYDGSWSGLGVGLMIGALVALICMGVIIFVGLGGSTAGLARMFADNLMIWGGGLLAVTLLCGAVGFFIGKATE